MDDKFKIGNTLYLVIIFVLIIGLSLVVINSNYILKFLPKGTVFFANETSQVSRLSKDTIDHFGVEEYLVIYNEKDPSSIRMKDNISHTLAMMKKHVKETTLSNLPPTYNQYKNVIITFESISKLSNLSTLESYTAEGGKVFFAIRPEINNSLQNIYRKLGIYEVGDYINPEGMNLTSNVLIKQKNLEMEKDEISQNSSLQVGLDEKCSIYIKSLDNVPLLWDMPYKKGKFMVFNGTMLETKENRGLISGAISMLNENYIYPILDMKMVFIDDFPAPVPEGINKDLYKEYQRDILSFYRDIWWPDILKSAAKYNIKYTGVVIQTYEDKVTPPFKNSEVQRNTFVQYGRELLKMGGEIGIHGYNHQSLMLDPNSIKDLGYNAWKTQADMEAALNITENYVKKMFPTYEFKTYVPPSNRIDQVGETAVKNAIPSINVLASLYLADDSQYTTVTEFEKKGGYSYLPRITSGYEYTKRKKWEIVNAITSIGVFNHFIHPDDILDIKRSGGKNWTKLEKEYDHILSDVNKNYPWLESKTARDASTKLSNYLDSKVYVKEEKNRIVVSIDRFSNKMSFILRTKHKIGKLKNCTVHKVDDDVYFVEAQKATIEIGLVD